MEISPCIQVCNLNPCIRSHIIHFTFIHRFWWQRRSDCKNLTLLFLNQDTCQRMSPSFKQHVSPLHETLFDKFIAAFGSLSRLAPSCQEYSALFILDTHKVSRDFYINHIRPIAMASEVIHK